MFVICDNKLIVDGETMPVDSRLITIALRRHRQETGEDLRGHCGPVSRTMGERIVSMERIRSLAALGTALRRRYDVA